MTRQRIKRGVKHYYVEKEKGTCYARTPGLPFTGKFKREKKRNLKGCQQGHILALRRA